MLIPFSIKNLGSELNKVVISAIGLVLASGYSSVYLDI